MDYENIVYYRWKIRAIRDHSNHFQSKHTKIDHQGPNSPVWVISRVSTDWDRYLNPLRKSAVLHPLQEVVTNLPLSSYFWKFWLPLQQSCRRWGRISISGFINPSSISLTLSFFILLLALLLYCCSFFLVSSFPQKNQADKRNQLKENKICQVCTVTRNLHSYALKASYSYALALLFSISANSSCTNQFISEISEVFLSQQHEYRDWANCLVLMAEIWPPAQELMWAENVKIYLKMRLAVLFEIKKLFWNKHHILWFKY